MLDQTKTLIACAIEDAIEKVAPGTQAVVTLERPKVAAHGDVATNIAMQLAKSLKRNPRELAQAIADALLADHAERALFSAVEVAGPGFLNLRLQPAVKQAVLAEIQRAGANYGHSYDQVGRHVLVEFVSANPTGPLHVGHGRQAALGDALCMLLESQGWSVHREFYYNDAGVQIATLATSVQARARGFKPGDAQWPESAYNGDYIGDIAADFLAGKTVKADDRSFTASGDVEDLDSIRQFAVAYLRHEQDLDLHAFGVRFDHYFLESSLYADGRVDRTVAALQASGKTFEHEGALWLRTTDFGDDKDRVMRKSDGGYTYFVPDVAYHVAKWERGFVKVVNIQGSDHHGTIARVRAGLQAMNAGIPAGYPDYILHKMVTVMRGGEEVKISKRAGSYVTLRDLIEMSGSTSEGGVDMTRGRDAVRFFLASRKADTEFVFDVDLALKTTDENPVYYVQYAHARICSVLEAALEKFGDTELALADADTTPLVAEKEAALLQRLAEFGSVLTMAANEFAPHAVAFFARDLAGDFHSFYNAERILVDDERLRRARLALLLATRQCLRNALAMLGVSAPARM
jgi:arginyl-tRNA synthetase